jgi:asparagine synthase (glutamine-hydrolysing)
MSGMTGLWNLDGAPLAGEILASMNAALRHRGPDGASLRLCGSLGFAFQHLWVTREDIGAPQPLVGAGGQMLMIDGRLDNRDELLSLAGGDPGDSDARLVLRAYERWSDGFAEHLNGDFAIALFDPDQQTLLLVRDAIGVRTLYYSHTEQLVAFASEIKALRTIPGIGARPDAEGVADFMLIGSRPLDRQEITCYDGISAVVPGHMVAVSPRGLRPTRYWDFDGTRRIQLKSFPEYVEAFRAHFDVAIRRRSRTAHTLAVSVSGGLDSSSIFCAAETARRAGAACAPRVHGISYVSERHETDEQRYLGDIERQYGLALDRFPLEDHTGLTRGVAEQLYTIEAPFADYMWGVTREVHGRASRSGARSMLSGHWGDQVLFSSAYLIDLLRRGAVGTIWQHTREYARYFGAHETSRRRRLLLVDAIRHHVPRSLASPLKWARLKLFDRERPKSWFAPGFLHAALRDRYALARFDRPFHSAHAHAVYLEARSKYHVQSLEWNAKVGALHGLDVAFPFLDRDLIAFLMAIPGEAHAHHGTPRVLLREALSGVLPESIRQRTWKADFTPVVTDTIRADLDTICGTLSGDCAGVRLGYFDRDRLEPEIRHLAAELDTRDALDSWDLGDTYVLEMWLRVFWPATIGQGSSVDPAACEPPTTGLPVHSTHT